VVTNTFDDFGTGSGIAPFNAVVGKVMAIGDIPGSSAVDIEVQWTLDGTIIGSGYQIPSVFWAVPRDPALNGKSPLIDVFLRTIDVAE
jgi:hypothetical protein